jgi:hypothetical protein
VFTDAAELNTYLTTTANTMVSFNGAAFDFQFLAEKIKDIFHKARVAQVAARSVDLMFDFTCSHGYRCSLNSLAGPSLGVSKTNSGEWAATETDVAKIIEYCTADVALLKQIHELGVKNAYLKRQSIAGKQSVWPLPGGFRTVATGLAELLSCPPDQSWQSEPMDIQGSIQWMSDALEAAT